VVIYHFAANELAQNTRRQVYFFNNQLDSSDFNSFARLRQRQLDQGRNRLKGDFILFNMMVLAGGGAISYALARRTLEPIENSLEAQKRFTADASHELRTPLTAIQSEIEVALRNPSFTKTQAKNLLKSNLEEVAKLKALSDGLLRLASTDQLTLDQSVSLKAVAEQAIERWSKIAKANKIDIKTDLSEVNTRGDQQSLVDLISILLDNAIKYSRSDSEVIISSLKKDKDAQISIADQGQGIKNTELPHIFSKDFTDLTALDPSTRLMAMDWGWLSLKKSRNYITDS
jgi:signal transduction histidine kinase